MEADRVHSYLKIACSALGFEIGEVWITSNEIVQHDTDMQTRESIDVSGNKDYVTSSNKSSADEQKEVNPSHTKRKRKIHFLQLYTSKNLNSILGRRYLPNHNIYKEGVGHVLSPLLVNAVADSSQIIWAHCQNVKDALPRRQDLIFQTAVGVPVAKDAEGNMFIVIMLSPNNISSSKDAVEYLQYIGTFATSTTIPCLLPVVKDRSNTFQLTYTNPETSLAPATGRWITSPGIANPSLPSNLMRVDIGSGITAQLISYDYKTGQELLALQDETNQNNLFRNTPLIEADNSIDSSNKPNDEFQKFVDNFDSDVFDDASYGLWSTIMNSSSEDITKASQNSSSSSMLGLHHSSALVKSQLPSSSTAMVDSSVIQKVVLEAQNLSPIRKDRLEEFASAFLGLSVFDAADIWVCVGRNGGVVEGLTQSFSVLVTQTNEGLNYFTNASAGCIARPWNGAVGRAFWSGNPVWSSNKDIIVESPRAEAYDVAEITTTLAVPIFSDGAVMPSCVMCFYSLLRVDSVPFVLRFIQRAIRLLWIGLDNIEPDESISRDLWENVAPADIGEMAADIEMQSAFVSRKKRRMGDVTSNILRLENLENLDHKTSSLLQAAHGSQVLGGSHDSARTMDESTSAKNNDDENTAAALAFLKSLNDMMVSSPLLGSGSSIAHKQIDILKSSIHSVNHLHSPVITALTQSPPLSAYGKQSRLNGIQISSSPSSSLNHNFSNSIDATKSKYRTELVVNRDETGQSIDRPIDLINQAPIMTKDILAVDKISSLTDLLSSKTKIFESNEADNHDSSNHDYRQPKSMNPEDKSPIAARIPHVLSNINSSTSSINALPSDSEIFGPAASSSVVIPDTPMSTSDDVQTNIQPFNLVTSSHPLSNFHPIPGIKTEYSSDVVPYCLPTSSSFDPTTSSVNDIHSSNFNRNNNTKVCEWPGCNKFPQGPTKYCISHGGGHRCQFPGCLKGARDKKWCTAHGGGKRCEVEGCVRAAVGSSSLCTAHGGGRRCSVAGCFKAAQSPTLFCVKHGGGKKCSFDGCDKVARGKTPYCAKHGGGVRCRIEGCTRVAIGIFQLCRAHGGKSQRSP